MDEERDAGGAPELSLEVPASGEGARVDRFVAEATGISRRRVMGAIERGLVLVNARRVRKGAILTLGQRITVSPELLEEAPIPQEELPLQVLYEDPSLLVVSKQAGIPTHPLVAGERGTLANAIVARYPACASAGGDPREGGVAHRLDAPTSGLVVVARSRAVWDELRRQFSERSVRKEYVALVTGELHPASVEVEEAIGHAPGRSGAMQVVTDGELMGRREAREAYTKVEVLRRFDGWTLVRCTITTGVMHQIRVHLAHLGHPIAGDDLYGGSVPSGLRRLFLHAALLGFTHPAEGRIVRFEAPLPDELEEVLRSLEE